MNHFYSMETKQKIFQQLMSLRTTVKKQKIIPNAEKIRPPPLISDFSSGMYFNIDFFFLLILSFFFIRVILQKCTIQNQNSQINNKNVIFHNVY